MAEIRARITANTSADQLHAAKNLPSTRWDEAMAPHAHHYAPQSGYVIVQYPPGTGLVLSMFPQGEAVYRLNRLVVCVFTVIGLERC